MKKLWELVKSNRRWLILALLGTLAITALLIYKLSSLTNGLSQAEIDTAENAVGWHGIFSNPLHLPIKIVQSVVFYIAPDHGQLLTRLPNVLFGGLAIMAFG